MNRSNAKRLPHFISASSMPVKPSMILAVDDDRIMLTMLTHMLEGLGHKVKTARGGQEALKILQEEGMSIDAIILDREMPDLSGLDVVLHIKTIPALENIPVIMLTGSGTAEQIEQGIRAGVFYYLVKPVADPLLRSVLDSALREKRQKNALMGEIDRFDSALKAMRSCLIEVQTIEEAEDSACFIASCFPEPGRVVSGVMELLVNAVEHGNLNITYDEKTILINEHRLREEIDHRLTLPEYADKRVHVMYQQKPEGWFVQISDAGKGFDWRRYWQIDPARATASHGRGIARARLMAFDKLSYNEVGNQVTAFVMAKSPQALEW